MKIRLLFTALFVMVTVFFGASFPSVTSAAEFDGKKRIIHPPAFKLGAYTNEIIVRVAEREIVNNVYAKDGISITFRSSLEGKLQGFRIVEGDRTVYISPESGIPGDVSRNAVGVEQKEWEIFYDVITPPITIDEPVPYVDVQKEEWEYVGTTADSAFDHVFKRSPESGITIFRTVPGQDFAFRPILAKGDKVFLGEYAGKWIPLVHVVVGTKTNLVAVVRE